MVLQNYAQTEYDINNQELKVFSRHSFDRKGLKIVGAVSVIFVQNIEHDDYQEEWQKPVNVSSSLSVITVPDFSAQHSNHNRNITVPNIESKQASYKSNLRSNLEPRNHDHLKDEDEFTNSKNVSIIDFSKPIETTLQDDRQLNQSNSFRHVDEGQGQPYSQIHQVQGHSFNQTDSNNKAVHKNQTGLTTQFIPLADISKIRTSATVSNRNGKLNLPKEIPKTIAMVTETPNYEQISNQDKRSLDSCIPKTIDALQEKRGPVAKTRPKFMRIRSLVVTKEKKSDVRCGICNVKLESCTEIITHSKEHKLDLKCCVCEASFASYCNMRRHCAGHVQTILHMCSLCQCAYKRKDNLQTHIRKHYLNVGMPFRHHMKHPYSRTTSHSQQGKTFVLTKGRENNNSGNSGNTVVNFDRHNDLPIAKGPAAPLKSNDQTVMPSSNHFLPSTESQHIDLTSDSEEPLAEESMHVVETLNQPADAEEINSTKQSFAFNLSNNSTIGHDETQEKMHSSFELENTGTIEGTDNQEKNKAVQNKILNYTCSSCNINFDDLQNLKRHILSQHSEDISNPSECQKVNTDVPVSDLVKIEMFEANQDNSQNFQQQENDMHIIDIGKLSEYSNQYVNMNQSSDLKLHVQHSAGGINLFNGNTKATPGFLSYEETSNSSPTIFQKVKPKNRHAERLDSVTPICRVCGIMFRNVQQVIDHKNNHPAEIPHTGCMICTADLSSKECLRRHIRNHFGEEYQCHYCQSKYNRKDNLYTHMKNSHGWVKPCKNTLMSTYYK